MRYPASWRTDQAEQDGVWYRYFLAPGAGPEKKPAVSVTLLAGPLGVPVEQYAATYLAENKLESSKDEERQGTSGHSYAFTSADGGMRYSLLLLAAEQKVYGLYAQGDAASFAKHVDAVAEMQKSFTLERPRPGRSSVARASTSRCACPPPGPRPAASPAAGTLLLQYTSPPLLAERGGQTVHASLTVTVEALAQDGLEPFYQATRAKLGEAFQVQPRALGRRLRGRDALRDARSVSRVKRYYQVVGRRGYSLTFESRDDVYVRAFRWYDLIASTFKTGRRPRSDGRPLTRLAQGLRHLLAGEARAETVVTPEGPRGDLGVPSAGDGVWEIVTVKGQPCLTPTESSYYLYFVLPEALLAARPERLFVIASSTTATASASSACSTPRATAPCPGTACTRTRCSAGPARRRGSTASADPSSSARASTPSAARTRGRPSGSSSAATCASGGSP